MACGWCLARYILTCQVGPSERAESVSGTQLLKRLVQFCATSGLRGDCKCHCVCLLMFACTRTVDCVHTHTRTLCAHLFTRCSVSCTLVFLNSLFVVLAQAQHTGVEAKAFVVRSCYYCYSSRVFYVYNRYRYPQTASFARTQICLSIPRLGNHNFSVNQLDLVQVCFHLRHLLLCRWMSLVSMGSLY